MINVWYREIFFAAVGGLAKDTNPGGKLQKLGSSQMRGHPVYRFVWISSNFLLALVVLIFLSSAIWEYSTRQYLKGFSDAVVPHDISPQQKVESILMWMAHGPARQGADDTDEFFARDPHNTLNYEKLLEVCGGATNAFINLSVSSGIHARRLLLLDSHRMTTHVVAEVLIDGRWIVVDPAFRLILRDSSGRMLTRGDLEDQEIFHQATSEIPGYLPVYNYSLTAHARISRLPIIGPILRNTLDWMWPRWEEFLNWTLILERDSLAALVCSFIALVFLMLTRLYLGHYGEKKLGVARVRLRKQVWQASAALMGNQRI
jgi:transglutaminase superfamily protein